MSKGDTTRIGYAYCVYYNGKKFVCDDKPTVIAYGIGYDDTIHYMATYETGVALARVMNERHRYSVKTCNSCGGYYMMTSMEKKVFLERGAYIPKICMRCRINRRKMVRKGIA